jgi:hypothetical protein
MAWLIPVRSSTTSAEPSLGDCEQGFFDHHRMEFKGQTGRAQQPFMHFATELFGSNGMITALMQLTAIAAKRPLRLISSGSLLAVFDCSHPLTFSEAEMY